MAKLKLAVLISGRGSNLQALIDACADSEFPAEIALVLSNKPTAYGLTRAAEAGIPVQSIDHKTFGSRQEFDAQMTKVMTEAGAELVCLAGFMRLLSDDFCTYWHNRMINIHPSLLPSFKGLDVHQAALDAGVKFSGCTVHYVRPEMDSGPIIAQAVVPILADDTADALASRILIEEHKIYPEAVRLIANGNVKIENDIAKITDQLSPTFSVSNPITEAE
jgi:phosphoribosylglycinamide formyltransferase-1